MCGIAGIIDFNDRPISKDSLERLVAAMHHRGPDDRGIHIERNFGIGHARLSILDLSSAGRQPMWSQDGRYAVIYNGEIYNFKELREELPDYDFATGTDTEVLLAAYQEWGRDCLKRFNGMWSFAIWDKDSRSVFLARDRYGIKPLFYYMDRGQFVFASEVKALHAVLRHQLSIDEAAIYDYLVYHQGDHNESTFVAEIKKLRRGHVATVSQSGATFDRWYRLADNLGAPWESGAEYKEVFTDAVKKRLRSDVPVGLFLSGGLDSSSIASTLTADLDRRDINAFSAVYGPGKHGDESAFIELYEPELPNLKYVYPTDQTLEEDMESFLDCHFEPLPTLSAYSQFKVVKEASKRVVVGLDGQGADEQLGGYHYFFGSNLKGLLLSLRWMAFLIEAASYAKKHRSTLAFQYLALYMMPWILKDRVARRRAPWVGREFFHRARRNASAAKQTMSANSLRDSLMRHFEYKLENNLKWNDLNGMYFSVELRVPFLDFRLVERTLASDSRQLIHHGDTKWILRQAMKGTLPEQIRTRRDKVGFANPATEWTRSPFMKELAYSALSSTKLRESGYLDIDSCRTRLAAHHREQVDISHDIWKWIDLSRFIERF